MTPPDLHTAVMLATEYDSETEPLFSVLPAMPPAPALHETVVEVMDPEVHERVILDELLEFPVIPPTSSTPVTLPEDHESATAMFHVYPAMPPAPYLFAPLLVALPVKFELNTPTVASYELRYSYPISPPTNDPPETVTDEDESLTTEAWAVLPPRFATIPAA